MEDFTTDTDTLAHDERPITFSPALELPIDDSDLRFILDAKIKESDKWFKDTFKLDVRSKRNEEFYLGVNLSDKNFDEWQEPYKDNVIWQNEEIRIALASSRIPDFVVTPAQSDDPAEVERAARIEKHLDARLKDEATKRLIKDGLRNRDIYFKGVAKARWDNDLGPDGDFTFDLVRPHLIGFDHTATISHYGFTSDNMEFIYEWIEEPIGKIIAKFPDKRDVLLNTKGFKAGTDRQMMSKLRYLEVWFTWYDKQGKRQEGICWRYQNEILGKMRNPYYDWEGYEDVQQNGAGGWDVVMRYRNHFKMPRKPYIFFTYQNIGKGPIDQTTAIEQSIPLQRTLDKRGRQITQISDNAVPKKVFSLDAFDSKEQIERVTNDPEEHIAVKGKVGDAFATIVSAPPSPILFQDMASTRLQMDSKFSTHGTVRGEFVGRQSGLSRQISRQGDLTIADDLATVVVQRVMYEMVNWAMQLMRMGYNKPHQIISNSEGGKIIKQDIHRDDISPDIAADVDASRTDKDARHTEAIELAKINMIDPYNLFVEMETPNPKERTQHLITFLMGEKGDPSAWLHYMQDLGIESNMSGGELGAPPNGAAGGGQNGNGAESAQKDIETLMQGQQPQPQNVDEQYVQTITEFVNSPKFDQLAPDIKQAFQLFISKLRQGANTAAGEQNAAAGTTMPNAAVPAGGQ